MGASATPLRRQYLALKRQYPDAILFFRLGDFYETFDEDAKLTARLLQITLTSREMGRGMRVPLAGVPYHAAESYIARLIAAGQKVAVCEQLDATGAPATGVGRAALGHGMPLDHPSKKTSARMMEREVVRVVTPGTVVEPRMLEAQRNNYLCALVAAYEANGLPAYGLAYADVTTGEFAAAELRGDESAAELARELERLQPAECVIPEPGQGEAGAAAARTTTPLDAWRFELETAQEALCRLFGVTSLAGYGCAGLPLATRAAGALVAYLEKTHRQLLALLDGLNTYQPGEYVRLDGFTRRNLELHEARRAGARGAAVDGSVRPTLFGVLDDTKTAMGGRLLRRWLGQPLRDLVELRRRHDAVETLFGDGVLRGRLRELLAGIADLERLTNRARQGIAHPRDLLALRQTLLAAAEVRTLALLAGESSAIRDLLDRVDGCPDVAGLIERAVYDPTVEGPGASKLGSWEEERLIKPGYAAELDRLVQSSADARAWIAGLEALERERTGIKSLKVGFNKVFGYYLHVSHAYKGEVPPQYIRRQTLADGERYITPELKEYENVVLHAAERIAELERALFAQVQRDVVSHAESLLATGAALAQLDTLAAFAEVAVHRAYVRPTLGDGESIEIAEGRHPVVEYALELATAQLGQPGAFVPNDCLLSADGTGGGQIVVLTGPNMAGKCLRGDTLVFTGRGVIPIEELKPDGAREGEFAEMACEVRGLTGSAATAHFYVGGRQRTIKVVSRLGFEIEGTPEHRVWARLADGSESWRRLGDLAAGDVLAIETRADLWGTETRIDHRAADALRKVKRYRLPDELDEDLAYVLGLLVGDGTATYRKGFSLSTRDEYLADEFRRIVERLFGYRVRTRAGGKDYDVSSRQLRVFLEGLGLGYAAAHEKRVPRSIMRAPRRIVVAFLQGLFDTDGYADKRYGNAHVSTSSPHLAHEVQLLLLNLGLVASRQRKETHARPSYTVSLYGAHAIGFHRSIGFRLPRKRERGGLASTLRMPNVGGIPHLAGTLKDVQERIASTVGKPVALKHVKSVNSIFYTYVPNGRNVSYGKLSELVDYCHGNGIPCPELEGIQSRHYFYDRVVRLEPREAEVYDLSVPGDHAYVAEGFVSHNSTHLRMVALICLMAQAGSFVPARAARIGLVDRIFTRVGAQDDLTAGQSTFMVEMVETATILRHATRKSLVILDEIGRGTSTYDGLAIAQAVVEHLHSGDAGPRTLFATHYHELAELEHALPRVRNCRMDVLEEGDRVVFLHRVVEGSAGRSYGIHVARLAGVPRPVTTRAQEILAQLESSPLAPANGHTTDAPPMPPVQLTLFTPEHPVVDDLRKLRVLELTPLQALNKLAELAERAKR